MGRCVDFDDLITAGEVAAILKLAHRNTVAQYLRIYDDFPRPALDAGSGNTRWWLRQDIERWDAKRKRACERRSR
jgi:glutathione-regulated potassium-efflux system ancillary protein KefG